MRLALGCALLLPGFMVRAQTTKNQFVGAVVTGGLIDFYKGDPANKEQLSFQQTSYLTVDVDGQYYSNCPYGGLLGPNSTPHPIDVFLGNDQTSKIQDTIKTVWKEDGFDIVQKVYPVAFSSSGVIVLSISIVNHSGPGVTLPVQAQYLLDNENSSTIGAHDSTNDNPFLIERYGYIRNWVDCPPSPLPSFYLAFEFPLTSSYLGTVGIGYMNDSFPPRPLGLLPLSFLEFGQWTVQGAYTWGPPDNSNPPRSAFSDEATLMMGQQQFTGGADSVTELMRTAYGTPEWCYQHGNMFGFALYPQHIVWDPISETYSPNPFQVQTFLYNVTPAATSNTTMRQTVGSPIQITNPASASPHTTQAQNAGAVQGDGFTSINWTDSVTVLPTGCTSSFPVDINFSVISGGIDTPIFEEPWACQIQVDCANPDTLPPYFQNSFTGCDSIMFDTVSVADNREFDLGLNNITYTSTDFTSAQYSVTIKPPPPYRGSDSTVTIYVQQIDTFKSGHVILTFTDSAKNISRDTLCFTAHPPLPDLTAPVFWLDSGADCHNQCTDWTVSDSNKSFKSIDRGVSTIVIDSVVNMTLSGVPPGGKYSDSTLVTTFRVCVTDSLLDGIIILSASDTSHNIRLDTIVYCTTPDTNPPIITKSAFDLVSGHIQVTDSHAWDRGIDSVWFTQVSNLVTIPATIPNPIGCKPTFDLDVKVVDTSLCASAVVHAKDCAGNYSILEQISFPKGALPVITSLKTILCSATDSIQLDAGPNFASYLWSTGETTQMIEAHKAGQYTVAVSEGVGCQAASNPLTITDSFATPQIAPAGPIAICAPDSTQLDGGTGFATYQWLDNGTAMQGMTSQKIWVSSTGSYSVQVTNSAGCEGISLAVSVTIYPVPPQPVINTSANNSLISTPGATFQWYLNDTAISGAMSQTYTPLTGGSYTVTITDANGCTSTSQPFGNAGSTVIAVPSMVHAHESDNVTIPLSIITSQQLPLGIDRTFNVVIHFNKTLLIPNGSPTNRFGAPTGSIVYTSVGQNNLSIKYTDTSSTTQGLLANLPFIAALGSNSSDALGDSCTAITIDSFSWTTPNIAVTLIDGNFCDTGLCEQGGPRLINPDTQLTLSAARPNPAYSSVQIDYQLIEHGQTTLVIYDLLGREILRLVDDVQEPGSYSVDADISRLPAGTYIYSLRTPTIVKSNHLQIAR